MAEVGLHCPKCHAGMASFQRSGIMVEQCATCRGVFLGEAELARLIGTGAAGRAGPARSGAPGVSGGSSGAAGHAANGHRRMYEGRHRRG